MKTLGEIYIDVLKFCKVFNNYEGLKFFQFKSKTEEFLHITSQ